MDLQQQMLALPAYGRENVVTCGMPIEHKPWVPNAFTPINGQKIAIVGYSHYRAEQDADGPGFTKSVMQRVIDGEQNGDSFFSPVGRYFGYDNKADFWSGVMFFNFIPECIGVTEEKYHDGTPDQIERAKARVLRILGEHKPDKVFVFTTKGWDAFPLTDQERAGGRCTPLMPHQAITGREDPSWGDYTVGDHRVRACGFRHPQFATEAVMKEQVQAFLTYRSEDSSA